MSGEIVLGAFTPWGDGLGPRRQHVLDAIASPDQRHSVVFEGITATLYTRRVEGRHPYSLLIVIAESEKRQLSSAVKVYDDLEDGVKDMAPLEMLRTFTQHFGFPVASGGAVDTLVEASMASQSEIMRGAPPEGDFSAQLIVRVVPGADRVAVALAWILDTEAYRAYLRDHA